MSEGVMTPRKKSVTTDVICSVGKVCTYTLLMTVCSTSNIRETRRDKINTGCCWNKFYDFNSLESSDSEQRVKGCQGDPRRTRKTTIKPEEACGKCRCSSVHPDRFPPLLRQAWWYVLSLQSWSRPEPVLPVLTVHHIILSSHTFARQPIMMFLKVTHHEVLDCTAAAALQKLHLGDACGTDSGVFQISVSLFTLVFLKLWCYVILATSSSLNLTPLTYLAGRL